MTDLTLRSDAGGLRESRVREDGEKVPARLRWANLAVGLVHLWHGSWVDFGIRDLPLAVVERRLADFVRRAAA